MVDRLNTKTMLRRRHISNQNDVSCVLCTSGLDEDIDHLFFECPFAQQCWNSIGFAWDVSLPLMDRIVTAHNVHHMPFFIEASVIAAWELWKIRNDRVFRGQNPSPTRWFVNFKNQCLLQSVRFKEDLRSAFCFWLDAFS
jgi:hypothetical protein